MPKLSSKTTTTLAAATTAPTLAISERVVRQVGPHDVLLGRGLPSTENKGNIRFREIVKSLLPWYISTGRRAEKDRVAKEVVQMVLRRNGRFLRRIESPTEADEIDLESFEGVWLVAEDKYILPKVKQTFRDQHAGTNKRQANIGCPTTKTQSQSAQANGPSRLVIPARSTMPPPVLPLNNTLVSVSIAGYHDQSVAWRHLQEQQQSLQHILAIVAHLNHESQIHTVIRNHINDRRISNSYLHNLLQPRSQSLAAPVRTTTPTTGHHAVFSDGLALLAGVASQTAMERSMGGTEKEELANACFHSCI